IDVPAGRRSVAKNACQAKMGGPGTNDAVRTVPRRAKVSDRIERFVTTGLPTPSVFKYNRHWRNRFDGLSTLEPTTGRHALHDGSPVDDRFPVRVSTTADVAGGFVAARTSTIGRFAANPAAIGRAVKDPFWYRSAVSVTLSSHTDIDASSVPMRMSSSENVRLKVPLARRAGSPLRSRDTVRVPTGTGDSLQAKPPTFIRRYGTRFTAAVAPTSNRSARLPGFPLVALGFVKAWETFAVSSNAVYWNRTRSST